MNARTRWIGAGILLASLLVAGGAIVPRVLGPKVTTVVAARRELVEQIVVSGRVMAPAQINVGSPIAGVARMVRVKEGDHVNEGDLLVALDDAELTAAVATAQAGLEQARARLAQLARVTAPVARQAHLQADANLEAARLGYERTAALAQGGSVPAAQLDEARRALDVAQGQHDAAAAQSRGAGVNGADHQVAFAAFAQAAASVAQTEVRRRLAQITAPAAATVLARSIEPGEMIQPGRVVLVLARDGDTRLMIEPDEKNLSDLRLGQRARASADAFATASFDATLAFIAPSIDPLRGTVEIRFDVPSPPAYLKPEMTVSVNVEVGRHPGALALPKEAVLDLATKPFVWALRDGHVEQRPVEVGLRGETDVEITRGASDGDRIVMAQGVSLVNGQRVRAADPGGS